MDRRLFDHSTPPPRRFALTALLLLALALGTPTTAFAEANDHHPSVHTIYPGQTLGMLAKRYRVSVAAIAHANGMSASHPIQPGDRLVIPARSDKAGEDARAQRDDLLAGGKPKPSKSPSKGTSADSKAKKKATPRSERQKKTELRSHRVYAGQTLGMIGRRYHVSAAAIAGANGIAVSDPIQPGEDLIIPEPDDEDGSRARAQSAAQGGPSMEVEPAVPAAAVSKAPEEGPRRSSRAPRTHLVGKGQTLAAIADRYNVDVDALCRANKISRSTTLHIERELVIPSPDDTDGDLARAWYEEQRRKNQRGAPNGRDWRKYKKSAWKRGYITLESPNGDKRWSGYVIGPGERLLPLARNKVTDVLASWRTGKTKTIDSRLVKIIAQVSDTFGGRRIRVVSGFREHSHSKHSRHPQGKALDFSIHGVPNWALRDFLRSLPGVGVGYYPNSSFVHLDVRDASTYWVDVSEPGQAPQYTHKSAGKR